MSNNTIQTISNSNSLELKIKNNNISSQHLAPLKDKYLNIPKVKLAWVDNNTNKMEKNIKSQDNIKEDIEYSGNFKEETNNKISSEILNATPNFVNAKNRGSILLSQIRRQVCIPKKLNFESQ